MPISSLLCSVLCVVSPALPHPQPPVPLARGYSASVSMTLTPPVMGGSAMPSTSFKGTASFANGKGRIDITQGGGPAMDYKAGDYILLPDSARVLYVRPSTQEYWEMDSPFLNPYAQMQQAGVGQITVNPGATSLDSLGAGEAMGSYATQRYRISSSFTISAGGFSVPGRSTIELTVAKVPVNFLNAALSGVQSFGLTAPSTLASTIAYLKGIAASGLVTKANSTTSMDAGGFAFSTIVATELSDLKEADVDESKLTLPTGYKPGG